MSKKNTHTYTHKYERYISSNKKSFINGDRGLSRSKCTWCIFVSLSAFSLWSGYAEVGVCMCLSLQVYYMFGVFSCHGCPSLLTVIGECAVSDGWAETASRLFWCCRDQGEVWRNNKSHTKADGWRSFCWPGLVPVSVQGPCLMEGWIEFTLSLQPLIVALLGLLCTTHMHRLHSLPPQSYWDFPLAAEITAQN